MGWFQSHTKKSFSDKEGNPGGKADRGDLSLHTQLSEVVSRGKVRMGSRKNIPPARRREEGLGTSEERNQGCGQVRPKCHGRGCWGR